MAHQAIHTCVITGGASGIGRALAKESALAEDTDIAIGWINPGMVVRAMVAKDARRMTAEHWRGGRRVFNLFA